MFDNILSSVCLSVPNFFFEIGNCLSRFITPLVAKVTVRIVNGIFMSADMRMF